MAIPLPDAARELGIEVDALRRWLRRERVTLMFDPVDHRRRMLRSEDFERLRQERMLAHSVSDESEREQLQQLVYDLVRRIEALEERIESEHIVLNNQIARMFMQITTHAQRLSALEQHEPPSA
jgi:hypothetical protein